MEKIDDFQDKLKKIEKVAEYIYSKKEEYKTIINFNSNFRIYSDLSEYLNFSKEVYFEDWFLDTYYYSLNEDLIKLYNLLENNKKQKKLIQKNFNIGFLEDVLFTLSPVMYFNEESYNKLIKVPKEELLERLKGKAKIVMLLEKGVYIIFNDKADITYEEFVEMNNTFKPLLGLI